MSDNSFKLDKKAVRTEILQADWMKSYIEQEANKKKTSGQHIKTFIGFDRAKSILYPNTKRNSS